jgi:hypothetical protein
MAGSLAMSDYDAAYPFRGYDDALADDSLWHSEDEPIGPPYRRQAVRKCICRYFPADYFNRVRKTICDPRRCICGPLSRFFPADYFNRVIIIKRWP